MHLRAMSFSRFIADTITSITDIRPISVFTLLKICLLNCGHYSLVLLEDISKLSYIY